jgi:hypothetical protein
MIVVACDVPAASALDRQVVNAAYFRDAYRAPLINPTASVAEIFFAVFGHHPLACKLLLVGRNWIARKCGLEVPSASSVWRPVAKSGYGPGETIGPWPVFHVSETELIAGRDNAHLDFRLSVLKSMEAGSADVTISTVCTIHNRAGRIYLSLISPFHIWGVQYLIRRAIKAGRL